MNPLLEFALSADIDASDASVKSFRVEHTNIQKGVLSLKF